MTPTPRNLGEDWEHLGQLEWTDRPQTRKEELRQSVKRMVEKGLVKPMSVSLQKSGDYADPIKQAETFSGTLEFDISVPVLSYFEETETRNEFREMMTDALMIWGLEKEERGVRTHGGYPDFATEIDSRIEGQTVCHKIRVGVTLPNPRGYTAPQCLDVFAHHIAAALISMAPDRNDVMIASQLNSTLYKICDAGFNEGSDPVSLDVREIETRKIPHSVSKAAASQ